jgi:uncharacterized protein YcbK (DUF882 family)
MTYWRHFSKAEVRGLEPALVARLDEARHRAGVPFIITSGRRTPEENAALGGAPDSAHLRGWAVDIRVTSSAARFAIVKAALECGFLRVGVYNGHVHLDCDPSLPVRVCWTGSSK